MGRLAGKTAVVTGGGRGLGSAISTAFAAEGAHVLVVDRNREAADIIVEQIKAAGGSASAETLDVSDRDAVMAFGSRMVEQYGKIDVLVNNAGIAPMVKLHDPNLMQLWDQTIDEPQWTVCHHRCPAACAEARWRQRDLRVFDCRVHGIEIQRRLWCVQDGHSFPGPVFRPRARTGGWSGQRTGTWPDEE